jgi:outer membrane protein assembly factor BamB
MRTGRNVLGAVLLILACVVGVGALVGGAELRQWSDSSGKFRVDAELIDFKDGKVSLRKADGTIVQTPLGKLSQADQKFLRAELKRRKEAAAPVDAATTGKEIPVALNADSGDWHQWRGPQRDGVSKEQGLAHSWPEEGPPKVWSSKGLGEGMSSVAVWDGHLYTLGKKGGDTHLICVKADGGEIVWSTPVGGGGGPNCTPTVDPASSLVYGLSHGGDLLCANAKTGEAVWKKNYERDFGGRMMSGWGYSESPLVDGDLLIVTPGGDKSVMAALKKKTGELVWATEQGGLGGSGYASVVISNGGGVKQYITLMGRGLIGVDAKTGTLLWHYDRIANGTANIPTPIVKGDYVFGSTGYGDGGSALLKLEKGGRGVQYREVWYKKSNELQNHHGGMVLIGDHIYMGHGHNNGFPVCVEMETGKVLWGPQRGAGGDSAALVAADGDLYFRYQNGVMALVEATPEKYNLKGSFKIASRNGESWPHPVIAGKHLYLRDQDELHCYDVAAK